MTAPDHPLGRLINKSRSTQVPWIITDLWQENGITVVHSLEEEFKSIFSYQMAEAIAAGTPLARVWSVPQKRKVGIFETEMDDLEVGNRFSRMYPDGDYPPNLIPSDECLLKEFRKRPGLEAKFDCLERWMREHQIEILVWDTINSVLAASGDPNSEVALSKFFDRLALLPHKGVLLVRHDCKPTKDSSARNSNQLVRGSNRIVEDASLVLHLQREDKAKNKVRLTVGKLRNGRKPEPREMWFDAGTFRLTPLHPLAALLEAGSQTRPELIERADSRFAIKTRALDEAIAQFRTDSLLLESRNGHKSVLALEYQAIPTENSSARSWWHLLHPPQPGSPLAHAGEECNLAFV